jgi:hypothetical protein
LVLASPSYEIKTHAIALKSCNTKDDEIIFVKIKIIIENKNDKKQAL